MRKDTMTDRSIEVRGRRSSLLLALLLAAGIAALGGPAAAQPFSVRFEIDLQAEIEAKRFDPATDRVGVRGAVPPLSWNETMPAEDPDGDGVYVATASFPRAPFGGQAVAYKFKLERPGAEREGWESGRNRLLFLAASGVVARRAFDAPPEPIVPSRVGTIRSHPGFTSRFVAARDVEVYLPPGYDREPKRRYPVLYLHDGQNVFDGRAAGMEWQVDETAQSLIESKQIAPWIVVAIANSAARTEDYTPTVVAWPGDDGRPAPHGGQGALYARFLIEELKPFVDRTYRTRRGAVDTAVGGASLGGLVSLWLALDHPKTFGAALAVSPAVRWDDFLTERKVRALPRRPPVRLWIDVGTGEGEGYVAAVRRLRTALLDTGWREGADFVFTEQEGGQHDEISWASRFEGMLRFLDRGRN